MQSWGLRAKFDYRSTETMPTKSGVIGLLAAALGLERSDTVGLAEISKLKLMTICVKEGTVVSDYHTVGGGYDPDNPDEQENCLTTTEGKHKKGSAVTKRQYLCDYEFLAVLRGDSILINKCSEALQNPVYALCLGRKSCFPSMPVHVGVYQNKQEMIDCLKANKWREGLRISCEVDKGGQFEQDVPINFEERKFTSRRISGDPTDWLS